MYECEFCEDSGDDCDFCDEENERSARYAVRYRTIAGKFQTARSKLVPHWYAELKVGELKITGNDAWVEFD